MDFMGDFSVISWDLTMGINGFNMGFNMICRSLGFKDHHGDFTVVEWDSNGIQWLGNPRTR